MPPGSFPKDMVQIVEEHVVNNCKSSYIWIKTCNTHLYVYMYVNWNLSIYKWVINIVHILYTWIWYISIITKCTCIAYQHLQLRSFRYQKNLPTTAITASPRNVFGEWPLPTSLTHQGGHRKTLSKALPALPVPNLGWMEVWNCLECLLPQQKTKRGSKHSEGKMK